MIHQKKLFYIIYISLALIVASGTLLYFTRQTTKELEQQPGDLPEWTEVAGAATILTIEISPYIEPSTVYKQWKAVRDYLAEKINFDIELRVARDYRTAINDVGLGIADLAYLDPTTYIEARKDYCVDPLATPVDTSGQSSATCILIARKDSEINSVNDLKGKSFAYGDEKSTCGTFAPHKWLDEASIAFTTDQGKVQYFPNYSSVIQAVASGDFEAGAVRESVFNQTEHSDIKIVKKESIQPNSVLVATFDMEKDLKTAIVRAFKELNLNQPSDKIALQAINTRYTGWQSIDDTVYTSLKDEVKMIHGLDYIIPADYCLIKPKCKLAAK